MGCKKHGLQKDSEHTDTPPAYPRAYHTIPIMLPSVPLSMLWWWFHQRMTFSSLFVIVLSTVFSLETHNGKCPILHL